MGPEDSKDPSIYMPPKILAITVKLKLLESLNMWSQSVKDIAKDGD